MDEENVGEPSTLVKWMALQINLAQRANVLGLQIVPLNEHDDFFLLQEGPRTVAQGRMERLEPVIWRREVRQKTGR